MKDFWKACLGALVCFCILAGPAQVSAQQFTQFYSVDCSNPSAQFPSISSALAVATDVPLFTCRREAPAENVTVGYLKNVAIETDWMKTFNLNGGLSIQSLHTVEIQGMIVTNASGDGINVTASTDVTLTFVSSVNNKEIGMALDSASQVNISGAGTFSNNGSTGINVFANSTLYLIAWGGTVDISNNIGIGLNIDRAVLVGFGSTTINNNQLASGGTYPNGFGINGHFCSRISRTDFYRTK